MLEIYKKINAAAMSTKEINTKLSLLPTNLQTIISNYKINEKKQQRIQVLN